jgi:hypothetical protein
LFSETSVGQFIWAPIAGSFRIIFNVIGWSYNLVVNIVTHRYFKILMRVLKRIIQVCLIICIFYVGLTFKDKLIEEYMWGLLGLGLNFFMWRAVYEAYCLPEEKHTKFNIF